MRNLNKFQKFDEEKNDDDKQKIKKNNDKKSRKEKQDKKRQGKWKKWENTDEREEQERKRKSKKEHKRCNKNVKHTNGEYEKFVKEKEEGKKFREMKHVQKRLEFEFKDLLGEVWRMPDDDDDREEMLEDVEELLYKLEQAQLPKDSSLELVGRRWLICQELWWHHNQTPDMCHHYLAHWQINLLQG